MGSRSTRKGTDGEREVAAILREHGFHVERGGTQSYGQRPDLYGLNNIHLEIKRSETTKIWEWMEQSRRDAARFNDGAATVIFRRSRSDWLVCMELSDWLTLYQQAVTCKCGENCQGSNGRDDYFGNRKQSGGNQGASVADDLFDAKGRKAHYDPQ